MQPAPKKAYKTFRYQTGLHWLEGRRGALSAAGRPTLEVSSPPEFKGPPGLWTPEDLFVAALDTCLLMTFLAYAQREELECRAFNSSGEGLLEFSEGQYWMTEVVLKPEIVVNSEDDALLAREILERAHRDCIVSNSVRTAVKVVPSVILSAAQSF
jgi:organic hydroperoxide reductase OsmC/OhrA